MLFCIPKYIWMDFNWSIIISGGYSSFSFMGLYLLARYVWVHKPQWSQWSIRRDFTAYGILSLITTLGILLFTYLDIYPLYAMFIRYSSPLIIAAALFLLLAFSKLSFSNTFINKVAASCLRCIYSTSYYSPNTCGVGFSRLHPNIQELQWRG